MINKKGSLDISTGNEKRTVIKLVVTIAVLIFLGEAAIMLFLGTSGPESIVLTALFDSALLVAIISPAIYFLFFRPMLLERKKNRITEKTLRQSEEKIRAIIRSVGDGVLSVNSRSIILFVNHELCKIFGYDESELLGKPVSILMPEKYRDRHHKGMGHYLETGETKVMGTFVELEGLHKDGSLFPIELRIEKIVERIDDDRIFTAAIRDISKTKEVETALKESEEKFRNFFHHSRLGMVFYDLEGRVLQANRAFCEMLGYSEEEIRNMSFSDFTHPDYLKDNLKQAEKLISGEAASFDMEKRYLHKEGKIIWGKLHITLIRDKDENPLHFTAQVSDITFLKETEEKLLQAHYEQNTVLENAIVGIAYLKEGKMVWANRKLGEIFGFIDAGMNDEEVMNFFLGDDKNYDELAGKAYEVLGKLESYSGEQLLRKRNGALFWCRISAKAIDAKMPSKGAIWIFEDITQRKAAEEALLNEKEKAEKATQLKDKFVSLVSHDLKGPLGTIIGFLKLAIDENGSMDEELHSNLSTALNTAENMAKMTDELLSISRLKTGKLKPEPSFQDAALFAIKAVSDFETIAREKGITLQNNVPLNTRLYADPALYGEVVNNLVSNAIKFSRKGDSITIYSLENSRGTLCIADTGVGIDKNKIEDIFKYEEKTSTKGTGGETGTGLGLPLCKDLIEAHGGEITVVSEPGKGSKFCISLPRQEAVAMIVDDNRIARMAIRQSLSVLDIKTIEAENGAVALDILQNHPVHIVITDINMPVMNGWELLEKIRKNPGTVNLPVLVMTGDNDMANQEKALKLGANDFSGKTAGLHDLPPRVRRFIP